MGALDDIKKLLKICHEYKLNFWCRGIEEYSILLTKIDIDNSMNDLVHNKKRLQSAEPLTDYLVLN